MRLLTRKTFNPLLAFGTYKFTTKSFLKVIKNFTTHSFTILLYVAYLNVIKTMTKNSPG